MTDGLVVIGSFEHAQWNVFCEKFQAETLLNVGGGAVSG